MTQVEGQPSEVALNCAVCAYLVAADRPVAAAAIADVGPILTWHLAPDRRERGACMPSFGSL
jgi:hypothetical protein